MHIQFRPEEEKTQSEREGAKPDHQMEARCGEFDLSAYINAWESLPPLAPPPDIGRKESEGGAGASDSAN